MTAPDKDQLIAQLRDELRRQAAIIEQQAAEIELFKQQVDYLCRQLYGSKSERVDPNQLELLLGENEAKKPDAAAVPAPEDEPAAAPRPERKPRKNRLRKSMQKLPEVVERLIPEAVKAEPEAYRKIREEVTERLECTPAVYRRRRIIREIHQRIDDALQPPVIAPLPKALLEGSVLTASLLADILDKKYCQHLPFYRQEWILKHAHGLDITRNMLCHWQLKAAEWLEPLYKLLLERLRAQSFLQADETVVRYLDPGGGKTRQGYFWAIHHPDVGVVYQWHTGRSRQCFEELLFGSDGPCFVGHLQCDAYRVYESVGADYPSIVLVSCLAHIRRKFHEALKTQPRYAGWMIKQIARLYAIEAKLRETKADHEQRALIRTRQARRIHRWIKRIMTAMRAHASVLPSSPLGKALDYALRLWDLHAAYLDNGELEIDNNQLENRLRPLKLGAKNWLFIGREDTGWRTAVVLTLVENVRSRGYSPRAYLEWVFEQLPAWTNQQDLAELLPEAWIARQKAAAAESNAA